MYNTTPHAINMRDSCWLQGGEISGDIFITKLVLLKTKIDVLRHFRTNICHWLSRVFVGTSCIYFTCKASSSVTGKSSSITPISLESLLRILPQGLLLKNFKGANKRQWNILACKFFEALIAAMKNRNDLASVSSIVPIIRAAYIIRHVWVERIGWSLSVIVLLPADVESKVWSPVLFKFPISSWETLKRFY